MSDKQEDGLSDGLDWLEEVIPQTCNKMYRYTQMEAVTMT